MAWWSESSRWLESIWASTSRGFSRFADGKQVLDHIAGDATRFGLSAGVAAAVLRVHLLAGDHR